MSKKPIFKDPAVQEQYLREGYVVLPALSKEDVEALIAFHDHTHPAQETLPNCYNTSDHVESLQDKQVVKEEISKVLEPFFKNFLNGYKPIYVNFIGKKPGDNSNRELHQDYSFCDERYFDGINIWIPLQDITEENSFFSIVRNSYRFFHSVRGRYIRHRFEENDKNIIDQYCTNIYPKAGEALVYNTASIHYTPNNTSQQARVAVSMMSIPDEADVNLFQSIDTQPGKIERYVVDEDFLLTYPAWKRIEGVAVAEVMNYDDSEIRWPEFKAAYKKFNQPVKERSFWKKLFSTS